LNFDKLERYYVSRGLLDFGEIWFMGVLRARGGRAINEIYTLIMNLKVGTTPNF